jgi:hypothetical protein
MKVSIGGVLKDVASIKVRIGGAWKSVTNTRVAIGGAWKTGETFTGGSGGGGGGGGGGFSLTPSSTYTSGNGSPAITAAVTFTPSGGVPPYTYLTTKISGSGTIDSPTFATTTFRANPPAFDTLSGVFSCTCTDSLGATATSGNIDVDFTNF